MSVYDILLSPAWVWHAPVGEALPADSVGYHEAFGGNWVDCGYTTTPLSLSINREVYEVMVEQLSTPVKRSVIKDTIDFETTLAEWTDGNIALAWNGATVTACGSDVTLKWGGSTALDQYQWCFEGYYIDGSNNKLPVRLFIYIGEAILNGQLQFAKNKEAGIPLRISGQPDTGKTAGQQIFEMHIVRTAT